MFSGGNNPIAKFNGSTPFVVNSTTGVISTGVPLDRETTADYTLCIKVSFMGRYYVKVKIATLPALEDRKCILYYAKAKLSVLLAFENRK